MRKARCERLRACALVACGVLALCARAGAQANPTSASATVYVHTDSDKTTVITPRAHVSAPIGDSTRVDLVYTTDVWSSASVDIRTSASKHLDNNQYQGNKRVTEQRDEIDVSVEHAFNDVTVGATYRYSIENDYESNGASLGAAYDFANKNSTLALTARAYFDKVGRAGDPGFERDSKTLGLRAAFTQIIDRRTLLQGIYELGRLDGYLSSPYRFVRIANDAGQVPSTCVYQAAIMGGTPVSMCLPERNPELRMRHAIGIEGRRALSDSISLGLNYRFYIDDWGILSHTAGIDVGWVPAEAWLLALGYRFYTQSAADQYAPFYPAKPLPEHYTSDKELTQLSSHRLQLELMRVFTLDDLGSLLRTVLRVAPAYFTYDNFPLLDSMRVLEVTVSMEVVL